MNAAFLPTLWARNVPRQADRTESVAIAAIVDGAEPNIVAEHSRFALHIDLRAILQVRIGASVTSIAIRHRRSIAIPNRAGAA